MFDSDEEYVSSIKSLAVKKETKINLRTRFLNGKMLMFSKTSIQSFVYDIIDVFMFRNEDIQKIYESYEIQKCFLYQNLADTESASVFFVFIYNLSYSMDEKKMQGYNFWGAKIKTFRRAKIYQMMFGKDLTFKTKN